MTEQEILGQHVEKLRRHQPPIPLLRGQAIKQAVRLRRRGLSYTAIATIMSLYHDMHYGPNYWNDLLRADGCAPKRMGSLKGLRNVGDCDA